MTQLIRMEKKTKYTLATICMIPYLGGVPPAEGSERPVKGHVLQDAEGPRVHELERLEPLGRLVQPAPAQVDANLGGQRGTRARRC